MNVYLSEILNIFVKKENLDLTFFEKRGIYTNFIVEIY